MVFSRRLASPCAPPPPSLHIQAHRCHTLKPHTPTQPSPTHNPRPTPPPKKTQDPESFLPAVPWGIISVKAQDEGFETPMQPITMMRNALGREEGGSGVVLDRWAGLG
jgi:hypothetical protein